MSKHVLNERTEESGKQKSDKTDMDSSHSLQKENEGSHDQHPDERECDSDINGDIGLQKIDDWVV
jgi:hypothetical protein